MVGKNSVANISIGEVTVEQNFAKGQAESNGEKSPLYFHFYKEDAVWKVDLTSIFAFSTVAFEKMQENSGQEENDFLFSLLERISGVKPGAEIWNKVN